MIANLLGSLRRLFTKPIAESMPGLIGTSEMTHAEKLSRMVFAAMNAGSSVTRFVRADFGAMSAFIHQE